MRNSILKITEYFGIGSLVVIIITLILFILALFTKGLTHDLLLESAVFLVSIKLILMSYKNSTQVKTLEKKLDQIYTVVQKLDDSRQ